MLCFWVIEKSAYANAIVPRINRLKFDTSGHDCVVLHEIDIRRKRGAFSKLGKEARETFLEALTQIIADVPMTVVAVVIDKRRLTQRYTNPYNPAGRSPRHRDSVWPGACAAFPAAPGAARGADAYRL